VAVMLKGAIKGTPKSEWLSDVGRYERFYIESKADSEYWPVIVLTISNLANYSNSMSDCNGDFPALYRTPPLLVAVVISTELVSDMGHILMRRALRKYGGPEMVLPSSNKTLADLSVAVNIVLMLTMWMFCVNSLSIPIAMLAAGEEAQLSASNPLWIHWGG
jgi:hypothetical protein